MVWALPDNPKSVIINNVSSITTTCGDCGGCGVFLNHHILWCFDKKNGWLELVLTQIFNITPKYSDVYNCGAHLKLKPFIPKSISKSNMHPCIYSKHHLLHLIKSWLIMINTVTQIPTNCGDCGGCGVFF